MDSNQTTPRNKTILVIEDHADTAEMLSLILESEGYCVQTAATADAALKVLSSAASSQIDVVLLDLTLPDMNGDDVIWRLKQGRTQVPPILIMSAKPAGSLDNAARSIGAAGIIRKPFDIQVLLESIQSELNKHTQ
jgi:DNA-binding response OmpR family regulator